MSAIVTCPRFLMRSANSDEEAHRVEHAVVAVEEDHARHTEQCGRRHIVARQREAVLKTGNAAARVVEVLHRLRLRRGPKRDAERRNDEREEHDDGRRVERLLLYFFEHFRCCHCVTGDESGQHAADEFDASFHCASPART
jgi:hypothetical protein